MSNSPTSLPTRTSHVSTTKGLVRVVWRKLGGQYKRAVEIRLLSVGVFIAVHCRPCLHCILQINHDGAGSSTEHGSSTLIRWEGTELMKPAMYLV